MANLARNPHFLILGKQDLLNWDGTAVDAFRERLSSTSNSPELTWIDFGRDVQSNLSVEEVVVSSKQSELITLSLFVQPFVTS